MDNIQTLLVVVVISLTVLLMVVGVQVLLVILDLRKAIRRLNSILGDSIIGGGLIEPNKLTGIVEMFKKDKQMQTHGEQPYSSPQTPQNL
jgi:hypothetical protein